MIINRISFLATTVVGLVILIDLASGQGPPVMTAYRNAMGPPPPIMGPPPMGYMPGHPRGEYDLEKGKEYELGKEYKVDEKDHGKHHLELSKEHEKEKEKEKQSTGMFGSLSNSMSGAWKSITGRQKRDVSNETSEPSSTTESQPSNTSGHKSGARSLDEYEFRQVNSPNYIYFKVPKNLVCYS